MQDVALKADAGDTTRATQLDLITVYPQSLKEHRSSTFQNNINNNTTCP